LDSDFGLIRGLLSSRKKETVTKPFDKEAILRQLAESKAKKEEGSFFNF
jgi:hypothetical protein